MFWVLKRTVSWFRGGGATLIYNIYVGLGFKILNFDIFVGVKKMNIFGYYDFYGCFFFLFFFLFFFGGGGSQLYLTILGVIQGSVLRLMCRMGKCGGV